jgi:hypothetical protein
VFWEQQLVDWEKLKNARFFESNEYRTYVIPLQDSNTIIYMFVYIAHCTCTEGSNQLKTWSCCLGQMPSEPVFILSYTEDFIMCKDIYNHTTDGHHSPGTEYNKPSNDE